MNNFRIETNTIWSFPDRGNWSVHCGDYPGNWSPYVPRNIILRYSKENEIVLDQFIGGGTTLIEAKLLNRRSIGCDINDNAIEISRQRINSVPGSKRPIIIKRDARNLTGIKNNSVDLICTHPPYANIIKYSRDNKDDLSLLPLNEFYLAIRHVAAECLRVLKDNKYCAILIGDTRRDGYIIPIGFNVMNIFLEKGFKLKEIVIKEQHNCKSTDYWKELSIVFAKLK